MATPRKPRRRAAGSPLEAAIGHRFRDASLLERALTHSSHAYEARLANPESAAQDNEVLEFLGDAVLGAIAADWLYREFPEAGEGELTRLRAALVNREALVRAAERLGIGEQLLLGRGEERSGGRKKAALLADALEALVAAIYLDGGFVAAQKAARKSMLEPARGLLQSSGVEDPKSALQEWLQARHLPAPEYSVVKTSGPDHNRRFTIQLTVVPARGTEPICAEATAATQKRAQQEAARLLMQKLGGAP